MSNRTQKHKHFSSDFTHAACRLVDSYTRHMLAHCISAGRGAVLERVVTT